MTPGDDATKAAMRAYADSLQPPPVAGIIARAEDIARSPRPSSSTRWGIRAGLGFATAAVLVAAVAALTMATNHDDGRVVATTGTTQPVTDSKAGGLAPACVPALPELEQPLAGGAADPKHLTARVGQRLTLSARIPATDADRPLLSFAIYLMPPGTDMGNQHKAVAKSSVSKPAKGAARVAPVLEVPPGLKPGTYDVVGYATWPGPSICGVPNPTGSAQVGNSWGVLGSITVS